MVNFSDPIVIGLDSWALVKLSHTVDALYIWEFFTTLDFEWRVIRGRVPFRWTIWIYSLVRITTLITVINNLIILNMTGETNCQAWATSSFITAYATFSSSSLLIILRIIAIWNKNKVIVGLAAIAWVANLAFLVQGSVKIRSAWIPLLDTCSLPNAEHDKEAISSVFITDIFLLVVMFVGLLRMRRNSAGTFALGRLLWKQGIAWLLLATVVELPPLIFIYLDLNDAFNLMFLLPAHIMMSIAATRIYRSLTDFCSKDLVESGNPVMIRRAAQTPTSSLPMSTLPGRAEVTVHTAHEKYQGQLSYDRADDVGSSV